MGDFDGVFAAQRAFAGRIVFTVDDFAPVDVEGYFAELIPGLARRGTIVTIFPVRHDRHGHGSDRGPQARAVRAR